MLKQWVDYVEKALVIVLAGFVFWPNAIPSIALISLLVIGLYKGSWKSLKDWRLLWYLSPAIIVVLSWIAHGFQPDGLREVQLWPTWIAALIYFRSSNQSRLFTKGFVVLSI